MAVTTVLFDLDGTLVDTIDDLAWSVEQVMASYGFGHADGSPVYSREDYYRFVGNGAKRLVASALEGKLPPDELETAYHRFLAVYGEHYLAQTRPYDGVCELLDSLQERGFVMGVVTNKPEPTARRVVEHFFGRYRFACVYGGGVEGRAHKPDAAVTRLALRDCHATAETTVYMGDSDVDVLTAHAVGMPCFGACWGFRGEQELRRAGADHLLFSPPELLNYVS